jgi:DNA-binding transcriptional ArsR family regulator
MAKTIAQSDFAQLYASADRACGLLKVLANPDRLLLLCHLAEGECCVSDMEAALDIHQPTLSQQLGVLRDEGLVATRREGKHIYYKLASPESMAIINTLHAQFCKPGKK